MAEDIELKAFTIERATIHTTREESDLFTFLESLLDEIPTSRVERYVTDRRSRKSDRN
jgi:hypothetical protein